MLNRFSPICRKDMVGTHGLLRHWQMGSGVYAILAMCLLMGSVGCRAIDFYTPSQQTSISSELELPRELSKVSLPIYRIEPPDVLQIEALKLVPRPPSCIETYDVLQIRVQGTIPGQPIEDYYLVEGEGTVHLGPAYGTVRVTGMTIDEASREVTQHLQSTLEQPNVSIQLARSGGTQQIAGTYSVPADGVINLGRYGMVYVTGKTVTEARLALEQQLAQYFDSPQVAVTVVGYNSKKYYVMTAGADLGESLRTFPIRGNETVLDAIAQIRGLPRISSKTMWVARATPAGIGDEEILPVDWAAIARGGATATNYQLLPGDRIYIVDDKLIATNSYLARVTDPIQRLLNVSSQGTSTIENMQTLGRHYNMTR